MKKFCFLWAPVILWAGCIFTLSSIPHLKTDLGLLDLILRKIAHLTEYAILGALLWRALAGSTSWDVPKLRWWTLMLAIAYAGTDEFHQSFVPGRGPSVLDVGIDSFGAYVFILLKMRGLF